MDRVHRQPGLRCDPQPVEPGPGARRIEWRVGGRARGGARTTRDDDRRRRFGPHPGVDVRPRRLQAHGRCHRARPRAALDGVLHVRRHERCGRRCRARDVGARRPDGLRHQRAAAPCRCTRAGAAAASRCVPDTPRRCRPRGRGRVRCDADRHRGRSRDSRHARRSGLRRGRAPDALVHDQFGRARAVDGRGAKTGGTSSNPA